MMAKWSSRMLCCIVTEMLQESLIDIAVRLSMQFIIAVSPLFFARGSARMTREDLISIPLVGDVDVVLLEALVPDDVHEGLFLVGQ